MIRLLLSTLNLDDTAGEDLRGEGKEMGNGGRKEKGRKKREKNEMEMFGGGMDENGK